MDFNPATFPLRPAWTEIDLSLLRRNLRLIRRDLPSHMHPTICISDDDADKKLSRLNVTWIHPHWRDEILQNLPLMLPAMNRSKQSNAHFDTPALIIHAKSRKYRYK
jgi:hypothetical protein